MPDLKNPPRRRCSVCDKPRDPETGKCPTPEECDRLRAPGRRLLREASATARRARRARMDDEHLGTISALSVVLPGDEKRHADAVRRAFYGWKRPRRGGKGGKEEATRG